ncbi:hypothetical protein [Alkalicoccobacillus plakortidis]|uniref:Uncharacterized protein n=1 Tax=Alkalicoccobacillus plakortidis TaxID=444060 RepID=A0ABT0XM47_9BACI|nr:hypothetical protein [Alkalicoccobacillus plakortidis]MCM2676985.1 hypothetical protein [Alkalicoccobacillus plakortidis]
MDEREIIYLEQWKSELEKELRLYEEQRESITNQMASLRAKKEIINQVSQNMLLVDEELSRSEFEQHFEIQQIDDELERLTLDLEYITSSNRAGSIYNELVIRQIEQKLTEWEQHA